MRAQVRGLRELYLLNKRTPAIVICTVCNTHHVVGWKAARTSQQRHLAVYLFARRKCFCFVGKSVKHLVQFCVVIFLLFLALSPSYVTA